MKEIMPLLQQLADQLGTTATHLWEILLRQAPISATIYLIQYGLVIVGCLAWLKVTKIMHGKIQKNWDEFHYVWIGIVWLLLIVFLIAGFICLKDGLIGFINPEYWALREILDVIKPSSI